MCIRRSRIRNRARGRDRVRWVKVRACILALVRLNVGQAAVMKARICGSFSDEGTHNYMGRTWDEE